MKRLAELDKVDRPRYKIVKRGTESLSDKELLMALWGSGGSTRDVRHIATDLLKKHASNLLKVSYSDLRSIKGLGEAKVTAFLAARELFTRLARETTTNSQASISSPSQAALYLLEIAKKQREYLVCIYLDVRKRPLNQETISIGTLDSSLPHPREIFSSAIKNSSAFILIGHNHPSGDTTPSLEDVQTTQKLKKAGQILGIPLVDHIIVSGNKWESILNAQTGK